jgi:hypothetical protein
MDVIAEYYSPRSGHPTAGGSVISQASTALTTGYGFTAVPPFGWISK